MKNFFRIFGSITFFVFILLSANCKKEESSITKAKVSGHVQKGPFINGTAVSMYELNDALVQTGKTFTTQITNNSGSFEINNINLTSSYVEFSANGYYFDEVRGDISLAPLTLFTLSDITDISTININILTHLEKMRVEYLVTQNMKLAEAKKKAQEEILAIFGYKLSTIDNSESLDISVDNEGNAILLAISIILQGNRTVGEMTELMAGITNDIREDGKLNNEVIMSNLRNTTKDLNLAAIRTNLANRYQSLGTNASIPDFGKFVNDFLVYTGDKPVTSASPVTNITTAGATLNGLVNANSLSTIVMFEWGKTTAYGDSIPAAQNPVTGSSSVNVSADKSGLTPGTLYHFRVRTKNPKGTTYSSDLSFTTLGQVPSASIQPVTDLQLYSATLNSSVNPNYLPTTVSFEWGTTTAYGSTIASPQGQVTGSTAVNRSAPLTGLLPGTSYHFRVKAENSLGTTFSSDQLFTTLGQLPSATTLPATGLTTTGVTVNGTVNANLLNTVVTFEYGTSVTYGSSTIAAQSPVSGNAPVNVSAGISGLLPGTIYHFRLKTENTVGITYGSDLTFTTSGKVPVAITQPVTGLTTKSVILNGSVNPNLLNTVVTFEYGTSLTYGSTVAVTQSPGTGSTSVNVSASIGGLASGTLYHYRVKAINDLGTTLGDDLTFSTLTPVVDNDGNSYNIVKIESQVWMAEDLKTTTYSNGDLIGTTTPASFSIRYESNPKYQWAYNGIESNVVTYGRLYTWYTATDSRNVCPTGWHLPDGTEWTALINSLGGLTDAGGKLKEAGITLWQSPNSGANNSSGFSAHPGGMREVVNSTFDYMGQHSTWWSSTENNSGYAYFWDVRSWDYNVITVFADKKNGYSVRCLRN